MSEAGHTWRWSLGLTLAAVLLAGEVTVPLGWVGRAYAKPPDWAPAHGYRRKQTEGAPAKTVQVVPASPDVIRIRCSGEMVGTMVGGAIGGAIGAQVGDGRGQTVATVAGVLVGMVVGRSLDRRMDANDRRCVGQVLEHAADHQTVAWSNPGTGMEYLLEPVSTFDDAGRRCRRYSTRATTESERETVLSTACRTPDGDWLVDD